MDQLFGLEAAERLVTRMLRFRRLQMQCTIAAERSRDPLLRASWLSAAAAYEVLRSSFEPFTSRFAIDHTDRLSSDSMDMPQLRGQVGRSLRCGLGCSG